MPADQGRGSLFVAGPQRIQDGLMLEDGIVHIADVGKHKVPEAQTEA